MLFRSEALTTNTTLSELSLHGNYIGKEGGIVRGLHAVPGHAQLRVQTTRVEFARHDANGAGEGS